MMKKGTTKLAAAGMVIVASVSVLLLAGGAAAAPEPMNAYFGNLHSHTGYSDGRGTPREAFLFARDTARYDFYAITDHGELTTPAEWSSVGTEADAFNRDGVFVAIRGFEWSNPLHGHATVWGTEDYTNAILDFTFRAFYSWLDESGGMAQFNHPGRELADFQALEADARVLDNMVAIETGNGGTGNSTPSPAHHDWYLFALDRGWRVAPTFGQDNHELAVGNGGRTAVLAPSLTRTAVMDALRERRVYSTDDPNMQVFFSSGDQWMGSVIGAVSGSTLVFDIAVRDDEPLIKLELLGDGGAVIAERAADPGQTDVAWTPEVVLTNQRYVLLRVTAGDTNGDMPGRLINVAYTAPIWISYLDPLPLPESGLWFTYAPVAEAVPSSNPSQAKPIGVGPIASGGGTVAITIKTRHFTGPVDMYIGLSAPEITGSGIFLVDSSGGIVPASVGIAAWKNGVTGPVDTSLFGAIPAAILPAATYHLFLVVTPAGRTDAYYLWETEFTVRR